MPQQIGFYISIKRTTTSRERTTKNIFIRHKNTSTQNGYNMKEIQLVLIGLIAMTLSMIFSYLTDLVPQRIENRER